MTEPLVYTPKEASELLSVSVRSIERACADGTLRAVKLGTDWRIPRTAIGEMLQMTNHAAYTTTSLPESPFVPRIPVNAPSSLDGE